MSDTPTVSALDDAIALYVEKLAIEDGDVLLFRGISGERLNSFQTRFVQLTGMTRVLFVAVPDEDAIKHLSKRAMAEWGWFKVPEPPDPRVVQLRGGLTPTEQLALTETGDTISVGINGVGRYFIVHPALAKFGASLPCSRDQAARLWAYLDVLLPDDVKAAQKEQLS